MGYRIEFYDPVWRAVRAFVLVAALATYGWGFYWLGSQPATDAPGPGAYREVQTLRASMQQLRARNSDLSSRVAQLQRGTEVDETATSAVKKTLSSMEARLLKLNDELAFYKGIVAPSKLESGLHVQDFRIRTSGAESEYNYSIVLTQISGKNRVAQGEVDLYIEGRRGDSVVRVPVATDEDNIPFKFKYFQQVEGSLKLPAGFTPTGIKIEVRPSSSWLDAVEQTFNWDQSLFGGI
ncbi:MAG: DUF6776 family protein [Gammaproteobacteria bacterium]